MLITRLSSEFRPLQFPLGSRASEDTGGNRGMDANASRCGEVIRELDDAPAASDVLAYEDVCVTDA